MTGYLLKTLPGANSAYPMPDYNLDEPPASLYGLEETTSGPLPKELIELILRTSESFDIIARRWNVRPGLTLLSTQSPSTLMH